ncbi:NlpC/P60 family protein [Kribbella antiqua]|uniref:NlpC/P60 family protein n=1 Tax=Kribbella antiqua TaxID=2512217 RepID=A0A4R2IV55_9ACTN|nr:NlpC/P60 family protein [Kribbella antiqua]TCO46865.1 NlpC/P60 family protein [Kribbella antiqua]
MRKLLLIGAITAVLALPAVTATQASAATVLGGVDMQRACDTQYPGRGSRATVTNWSSAYSWKCVAPSFSGGIDVNRACATQYSQGAYAGLRDAANPYTWFCQGWASSANMLAAANWAIAEKNSPDPTWSDHYGHQWSGWCEQFVEQAGGFRYWFPRAIDHYNWQLNNGRIHPDTNPPRGAVVFYGGGEGAGHVGVSLGGQQVISTQGNGKLRLPVWQHNVTGLSNPYLGWAYPIGA